MDSQSKTDETNCLIDGLRSIDEGWCYRTPDSCSVDDWNAPPPKDVLLTPWSRAFLEKAVGNVDLMNHSFGRPVPDEENDDKCSRRERLVKLSRQEDLREYLEKALHEIVRVSEKPKAKKRNDKKPDKNKSARKKNDNGNDDDDEREEEEVEEEEEEEDGEKTDPATRMVVTLNSRLAVTPHAKAILTHEDMKDCELVMEDGTQLKKKKKVFLFSDRCYDVATTGWVKLSHSTLNSLWGTDDLSIEFRSNWLRRVRDLRNVQRLFACTFGIFTPDNRENDNNVETETSCPSTQPTEHFSEKALTMASYLSEHFLGTLYKENASTRQKQAVQKLVSKLSTSLKSHKLYRRSRLSVYGSCLSNLTLEKSDVDISLHLPDVDDLQNDVLSNKITKNDYAKYLKKHVFRLEALLKRTGFEKVYGVSRARVPVIKGCYLFAQNPTTADGSMRCVVVLMFRDVFVFT